MKIADHRDAVLAIDAAKRVHHPRRATRIERGDRFVGEQHSRLLHQRAGNRDTLLLAARQAIGALQDGRRHLDPLQRDDRKRSLLRREQLEQRTRGRLIAETAHQDIGEHIETRHQVELLENHRALPPPQAKLAPLQCADSRGPRR